MMQPPDPYWNIFDPHASSDPGTMRTQPQQCAVPPCHSGRCIDVVRHCCCQGNLHLTHPQFSICNNGLPQPAVASAAVEREPAIIHGSAEPALFPGVIDPAIIPEAIEPAVIPGAIEPADIQAMFEQPEIYDPAPLAQDWGGDENIDWDAVIEEAIRTSASNEGSISEMPAQGSSSEDGTGDPGLDPGLCCWEHGCQGRRFSTRSNLIRHLNEKSKQRPEWKCPNCKAIFSRTSARNQHVAKKSCNRIRRYSNGRERPLPRVVDDA